MPLRLRLTPYSTLYLCVLAVAVTGVTSWATFTAYTAKLDKHSHSLASADLKQTSRGKTKAQYGDLPLSFELNRGQADGTVKFLARGVGYNVFLTPTEAALVLSGSSAATETSVVNESEFASDGPTFRRHQLEKSNDATATPPLVVRMKLDGASPGRVEGVQELPGKVNYFIGDEASKWLTDIPTFRKVAYRNVYKGIDAIYYGNRQQLEYDLVVAAGADPSIIKIKYEGSESLRVNGEGTLLLKTRAGEIQQPKPLIYQQENGQRKLIEGRYVVRGSKRVGFQLGKYDRRKPLVIDPKLVYLSLVNGGGYGYAIAVDANGSAYIAGEIFNSTLNPTPDGFQTNLLGGDNAFITKLDASGTSVVYSTYLGSANGAYADGIAVDGQGNAYVTGGAGAGFPTTAGAYQTTNHGNYDCFVTKLNPSGSALVYSTFYGGNIYDEGDGIAVDAAGNAYIGGIAGSTDLITTAGAPQSSNNGGYDGFAIKLNPSGSALTYATYFGGGGADTVNGTIAFDSSGNAYITGQTSSFNLPQVNSLMGPGGLNRGIFKSTNSGSTWSLSTTGLQTSTVNALVVDRLASNTIYAATAGGVYKTIDAGLNWSNTGAVLPNAFALAMANSSTIYVGTDYGVNKTTNAGTSWTVSYTGNTVRSLAVDPTNSAIVYAGGNEGLLKSTNSGGTWTAMNSGMNPRPVRSIVIDPTNTSIVYLAAGNNANSRVFKSTNGGTSWALANTGLPASTIFSLALDPNSVSTLYAGTNSGMYKTTNGGTSWSAINNGLLIPYSDSVNRTPGIGAVAISTPSTTVYATSSSSPTSAGAFPTPAVFKSTDGGATWTANATGLVGPNLVSLAIDPNDATKIYVGNAGDLDGFFIKVNPTGTAFLNVTYVGSSGFDSAAGVAVDSSNSPYILGYTQGGNFQTSAGAFQTSRAGIADAYVMKLNPASNQISYSTLLGGLDNESTLGGIVANASGNAFVTGFTASSDFPTTAGSFQRTFGSRGIAGNRDSFITELNSTGTGLVYSSYLGGAGDEPGPLPFFGSRLALDPAGNTYVVGTTSDPNTFPSFDSINGFNTNGTYVAKIDPNTPSFSINGRLTTSLNVGIAGIFVYAEGPTGVYHSGVTDSQGYYSIINLPPGDYTVAPNKCCDSQGRHYTFAPATRTFAALSSDQIADFTGTQVFRISGQITSSVVSGQGLFDIPVTLSGSASASVVTDVFGFFSFEDLPTGNYTVTPSKLGFVFSPTSSTFNSLSADQNILFTTSSATLFTISGHVADGANAPISGVTVSMLVRPMFGYNTLAAQTDASGNYSFGNLQAGGNYTVTPGKPLLTFNPISPTVSNLNSNQTVNFTATAVTGLTGKIAFMKFDQAGSIATMNADGTGETNLITQSGECSTDESGPAWSPDGARIAFSGCNQFGVSNLYLMNSDGSNATQLTNGDVGDIFPNWSPDGTRLTFTYGECSGADNQIPEIFTMDIASKVRTQLTNNNVVDATSAWSPNGSLIAFARGNTADCSGSDFFGDIYTITPQGTNLTRLTNVNALSYLPTYSPDGSKIAFVRETDDFTHNVFTRSIYVMNADGTNQIKITPDTLDAVKPTWSPDGSRIAFSADTHSGGAYSAIFVVNPDGTGLAQITNSTTASRELPDWQHILTTPGPTPTPTPAPGAPSTSNLFGVLSGFSDINQSGDFVFLGAGQSAIFLRRASDGTTTRLYQMSDPVPGIAGSRGELFTPTPRINNSGKVAFATDYIANAQFLRAILFYNGSSVTPIINATDIAPNSAGAPYGRTITLGGLNNTGDVAFTAIPNGVSTLYILPNGGSSVRIAGGGDAAPGTSGTFTNIALANGANSLADNSGEVLFTAQIVGGSGGFGVFVGTMTGVRKVVANGDAIPGGGTFSITSAPVARLNRFGQVAFVANNATSNSTIWMHTPATGIVKAVSNGDAAPAALGGTFSAPTLAAFNDNPYVAFTANVNGSGVTSQGVFRVNPGSAIETVAFANQAAPGASPATFSTFAAVSMDNVAGVVSFQSTLTGGSIGHGLFRQSGANSPVSIVLDGQSAAVPGGGTFNLTRTSRSKTLDNGTVYSFANVFSSPTTYAEFVADTSSITILMNDGTPLPAGTRTSLRNFRVGAAGDYIAFMGQSTGGRRSFIIRNLVTGGYSTLFTEGDAAPGGGRLRMSNLNVIYVNASGTIVFQAQIIGGPLGISSGIFSVSSSGTITKIVADGDLDPNTNSTFSGPSLNTFAPSPLNNAGQVVFRATVLSKLGIYFFTPGNPIQRIAQNGDAAPGGGTFATPSSVQAINSVGQVAFFSTTSGGPGSNQGIFVGTPGAVAKVVVSGDAVPGSTTFATFPNVGYSFNDSGEVAFKAALNGGALAGVFVGTTVGVQTIALNGNFSFGAGAFNTAVNADVLINNHHDLVFHSALTGGGTDSAYFLRRGPAGSLQLVAAQGQAAPGTNGTFATLSPTLNSFVGENFALGPTGEVAFTTNTVLTSSGSAFGAFRLRTDNLLEKILARADIVPGTNGGIFPGSFQGVSAGGPGHFALWAPVAGGSVDDLIYVTNSPAVDIAPSSALKITGRVLDNVGNPLSGITVNLTGTAAGSTQTDASGNYSFLNLASGNYTVSPFSAGYAFTPSNYNFNLTFDHVCVFVAAQTAVGISGKVTDSNNAGLNGVTVTLTKNGAPAGTTQTNAQGDYSFASLTTGDSYVVTPNGSFSPSSQTFGNLTTNAIANFQSKPGIPPQCSTPSFATPNNFAVANGPQFDIVGEFNGDNALDLAVANPGSNNISILLGTGTGTFGAAANFSVGSGPGSIAVGDVNGDGKSDLLVANFGSNNISVLLGTGTGSFGAATNFAVGSFPRSVVTGDFNGDGKLDLAVANQGSNNVSILLGSGTGSFGAATNLTVGTNPVALATTDFNGDGQLDLATANAGSNNVSILLGTGTGSFSAATNFAVGSAPFSIGVGNLNGDSSVDLVVTNSGSNSMSVLMGTGGGNFGAATNFGVGTNPVSVTLSDFNGDGKTDVAVANRDSQNMSVLLNDSVGGFASAANFAVGTSPRWIAFGDLNGDGKADLVTANIDANNVSVLLNSGSLCNIQSSLSISGRVADALNHSLPEITVTLSGPVSRVTQTDASGNYSFPNLTPGGNYTVTVQTPYYIVLPSRTDFFNLTSSQTANFVAAAVAVPSPSPPPSDNFNTPTRDATKWSIGTQTEPSTAFDPQVTSAQVNGRLVITPLTQAVGMHYSGYVSANSFDMRNSKVSVELVQAATGGADSIFSIGSDANNFFRFMVHTTGTPTSLAPKAKGPDGIVRELDSTVPQLVFQVNINGVITSQSINYSPVQHRFLRFRNELPGPNQPFGAIVFETSSAADFSPVSFQYPVALTKGISPMTAELSAGTSNPTNPGQTIFDNYGLVTSTFQFTADRYSVTEGTGSVLITVTRAGSISDAATVHFETGDGTATQIKNYLFTMGTLSFAPQETTKTFTVPIVDNALSEGNLTLNLFLGNPVGSGLNAPGRAVITIVDNDTTNPGLTTPLLQLVLEQSGPSPNQAAALDAVLLTRDPFSVINTANVMNPGADRNTRVILFVMNLQLAQAETASAVVVNIVDANNHSYDVAAEQVQSVTNFPFTEVIFRLPDNLPVGTCTVSVKAHGQIGNVGTIRIKI